MADDLVKRLRHSTGYWPWAAQEAANRIEELEAERNEALNQLDSARHRISVLEKRARTFYDGWAIVDKWRIEAEAKLAKAIETLQVFADDANWFDSFELDAVTINPTWRGPTFTPEQFARDVIEELKGGSDEQTTDSHDY